MKGSRKKSPRKVIDEEVRMRQLCQHGAIAASSPAAQNHVAVPGPGSYSFSTHTEEIIKPLNSRVLLSRRPRFLKEGKLFNPGLENSVPGPGSYDANKAYSMGMCKLSKEKDPPKTWSPSLWSSFDSALQARQSGRLRSDSAPHSFSFTPPVESTRVFGAYALPIAAPDMERMQVCRYLKLEGAPRDSTVFKQGDRGDKFYLILYGSVGVFITEVEAKDVESKESKAAPSAASGEAPQVAAQAHGPTSPASPAKPVRGGWAKLQKLVHNAVPPAVELELVEEAKELEPQEDVEVEELQPEEPQEDRKEAKRVTIAATGTQEGPTPSTEGHGGEAVPDRGDGKEYRKLQMNRSESRLSVKSTGSFLRSIALLKNLPNIPNLAALMQRRVLCRHGLLINIGVPVMHMYMVFEGNFSLRGRIKRIKTEEKEKKGEPKAGTSGTSDVERRRRPSDLEREKEPKDKDKFDAKIEKQTVSRIAPGFEVKCRVVLSVMPPGSTYGLSHFLKGEREHLRQVICESSSGLVYTLFAKDVAAHLSQQERLQVVATASAEEAFFRQRCQCVNQTSPRDEKTRASETPADMSMLRPWHMQELAENVYHACHDVSNPGALAADLQTAVEKDIRMARRAQNQFLVPLVRRPFNPLEDEPLVEASEARAQPSEPVPTRVSLQNPKRRLSIPSAWKSEPSQSALAWAICRGIGAAAILVTGYLYMPLCALLSALVFRRRYGWLEVHGLVFLTLSIMIFVELGARETGLSHSYQAIHYNFISIARTSGHLEQRDEVRGPRMTMVDEMCMASLWRSLAGDWWLATVNSYVVCTSSFLHGNESFLWLVVADDTRCIFRMDVRCNPCESGSELHWSLVTTLLAIVVCLSAMMYQTGRRITSVLPGRPHGRSQSTGDALADGDRGLQAASSSQTGADASQSMGASTRRSDGSILIPNAQLISCEFEPNGQTDQTDQPAEQAWMPPKRAAPKAKPATMKYTIDCQQPVDDNILEVKDFEHFLMNRIKVDGKTGNLGDKITSNRTSGSHLVRTGKAHQHQSCTVVVLICRTVYAGLVRSVLCPRRCQPKPHQRLGYQRHSYSPAVCGARDSLLWRDALTCLPVAACFSFGQTLQIKAYGAGISASVNTVLGYFYMPMSALLSRWVSSQAYSRLEWLALALLSLTAVVFCFSRSTEDATSTLAIACCVGSVVSSCIGSLMCEKIMKARPYPFYTQKVHLEFGGLATATAMLFVVGSLSSRPEDAFWKQRPANGQMEAGLFVGWSYKTAAALTAAAFQSWLGGLVSKRLSTVVRSVAQCCSLLIIYFLGDLVPMQS
eukprot:g22238.t3